MGGDSEDEHRPPQDRIWGADRILLYLEGPVLTLQDLDGSRESAFRKEARKFLDSPSSVFDKHPEDYIGHIRELNSKTRAFATWCQHEELGVELCVVHEIYRKENESDFWYDLDDYNNAGAEFNAQFRKLNQDTYDDWVDSLQTADEIEVICSN